MNEEKLYLNFARLVTDTIKEKALHKYSFNDRLGYKDVVSNLATSILIIQLSYENQSEYCNKFLKLHERITSFYKTLKATKEWN